MAQPATNPKIEELRFKVKTDPKSRLFYPLAEELRKVGQHAEAEQVLRGGLSHHAAYLSAWVGLGRVLRDQDKDGDAVEALKKALQIDPGNVVAARLMADAYLALGEKVEAIKKYKLVFAQLSGDEDLEGIINRLDTEINAPNRVMLSPQIAGDEAEGEIERDSEPAPRIESPRAILPTADLSQQSDSVFDVTYSRLKSGIQVGDDTSPLPHSTGDVEPMSAAHEESPFEEPGAGSGYGSDAFAVEQPAGMSVSSAPISEDLPAPFDDEAFGRHPESDPFSTRDDDSDAFEQGVAPGFVNKHFAGNVAPAPPDPDDFARTITMADLYANQGLIDEARDIYEDLLLRDPSNASLRAKIDALDNAPEPQSPFGDDEPFSESEPARPELVPVAALADETPDPRVQRLETWLSRIGKKRDV